MLEAPILVTGAGGCIGAWVIKKLHDAQKPVIAFDLSSNPRRLALLSQAASVADTVIWETGDIADFERVNELFSCYKPMGVIHLAALQVPFCIEDPVLGARVNVVGGVNVFEAARRHNVKRVVYASSVAATAMDTNASPWKQTLYGAYKICNEQTARVYWHDWQIPSIGIRPSVVYGPARDQGMSAAPTQAMLAAVLNLPYIIPFTGEVGFVHAGEAASAFINAVMQEGKEAKVLGLNGITKKVEDVVDMIRQRYPGADITCSGAPLPFPADGDDDILRQYVGDYWRPSFVDGVDETLKFFQRRVEEKIISASDLG